MPTRDLYKPNYRRQELICPGCNNGPFARMSSLMAHIEAGECTRINIDTVERQRDTKVEFTKNLVAQTGHAVKYDYTGFLPTNLPPPASEPWIAPPEKPVAVFEDADFPSLPGQEAAREEKASEVVVSDEPKEDHFFTLPSNEAAPNERKTPSLSAKFLVSKSLNIRAGVNSSGQSKASIKSISSRSSVISQNPWFGTKATAPPGIDQEDQRMIQAWVFREALGPEVKAPSTATLAGLSIEDVPQEEQEATPAWTSEKALFPEAPAPQAPSEQQLASALGPSARQIHEEMDIDHPSHPAFNVARYLCEYGNVYACPNIRCMKTFKSSRSLIGHLRGPAHGSKTYTCPGCLKQFKSLQAITSHAESASVRCTFRDSGGYRAWIDQLTAGIVDANVDKDHGKAIEYSTSSTAKQKFGKDMGVPGYVFQDMMPKQERPIRW